jgi:hypothetical protein
METRKRNIGGIVVAVITTLFGVGWTIMAGAITRDSPFLVVGTIFPLFGIIFVIIGVIGIHSAVKSVATHCENNTSSSEGQVTRNYVRAETLEEKPSSAKTVEARLKELEAVKDKGIISQQEYSTQRKRILEQL